MGSEVRLVEGPLARQVAQAVADIARELEPAALSRGDPATLAEAALFYAYVPEGQYEHTAHRLLERAIELATRVALPPALDGGFLGVAWVIEHLKDAGSGGG